MVHFTPLAREEFGTLRGNVPEILERGDDAGVERGDATDTFEACSNTLRSLLTDMFESTGCSVSSLWGAEEL